MRRLLVIFLILLFPLNVLALSMSVSTAQPDGAHTHASMTSSDAFQGNVDYAQLIKMFGEEPEERQYSPGKCLGTRKEQIEGYPLAVGAHVDAQPRA